MSEENRKTDQGSKILPFHITDEEIQDPETDRIVRESLIREADELEREINSKPELAGIEAPEGLFESIVEELKARGVWEEDEEERADGMAETANGAERADGVAEIADGAEYADGTAETANGAERAGGTAEIENGAERADGTAEIENGAGYVGDMVERVDDKHTGGMLGNIDIVDAAGTEGPEGVKEPPSTEGEPKADAEELRSMEGDLKADAESLEAIYAQLPEADQKALALGRQMVQRKEAKAGKRRRRRKFLKVSGVVAACFVAIFALSMTSAANRRLVKKMWDGLMMDLAFKVSTNYLGEEESVRSRSQEELEAMEEIKKETGAPAIYFGYLPKGMKYQGYEITGVFETALFYSYQERIFSVMIIDVDEEGSYYYMHDGEAILRDTIVNNAQIEAEIWETNLDIEEETYIVEIEKNGWRYVLNGMLPYEEMKKIVEYLIIL